MNTQRIIYIIIFCSECMVLQQVIILNSYERDRTGQLFCALAIDADCLN